MKAAPLLVTWHNESQPVYSVHFEPPHGKGRLATAGGDGNVRLWQVEPAGDDRRMVYLATLSKHTQAVNVVRWCPKGELLASASDDSNVLLWAPSEFPASTFGEDNSEDKEHWIVKRMCRSNTPSEIYDLAWSPDGAFFITGSMDNIARIYDASTGAIIRQIAEHNHYVQGVAWDPLNEFIATQSSDRSVHVYSLKQSDGQFSLTQHGKISKMDLPARRRISDSPAPPELMQRARHGSDSSVLPAMSPAPSAPGTPASLAPPMNPPPTSHSRRSSMTGAGSPMTGRSASPAPSMPLPAVMPGSSPKPNPIRNSNIYANESLTSFFRRLTFSPDGSLLFTPAGQYKKLPGSNVEITKPHDDIINTVYIYSRGGLNKPPVAHLPGHKKPSIAVRCSPIVYNLRLPIDTKELTIDTSKAEDIAPLPEPALPSRQPSKTTSMDPPPSVPSPAQTNVPESPRPSTEMDAKSPGPPPGPQPAFALPYRIVYAVATQDAVFVYDTQQQTPIVIVSNLHFATFTDLTWSVDGLTLLMSSTDGFCSSISFASGELGTPYKGSLSSRVQHPAGINTAVSAQSTPIPTPTNPTGTMKQPPSAGFAQSPSSSVPIARPASPTRSNSTSSIATQSSFQPGHNVVVNNPTPAFSAVPGLTATASGSVSGISPTPPMTPLHNDGTTSVTSSFIGSSSSTGPAKREGEAVSGEKEVKKRKIAPTLVSSGSNSTAPK